MCVDPGGQREHVGRVGVSRSAIAMGIRCALGIALALLVGRFRSRRPREP